MRILFISRTLPYLGGREVIVDNLIDYFSSKSEVMVLTPDNALRRRGVEIIHTDIPMDRIKTRVERFKPEIISCHTFYLADRAIELAKIFDIPVVFTFHGVFIRFYGKDYRSIIRRIYKNSNCVVTVSENYRKQLIQFVKGQNQSKIKLIRNGIAKKESGIVNHGAEYIRKEYKLPSNKRIVIVPVRLNKVKGVEYVIRAAKKIKNKDISFVISSPRGRENPDEKKLKKRLSTEIQKRRLSVIFRNYSHQDLQNVLPACDICLMPSLIEGISLSILESMRAGLFVIATKVGGTPEVIRNTKDGFLIRAKHPSEIISAIGKVINLPIKTRIRIIRSAKRRVRNLFAESKMFVAYSKLFKRIVKNPIALSHLSHFILKQH